MNSGLTIINNPNLSVCSLPNLCVYLSDPSNLRTISGNAAYCLDETAVAASCGPCEIPDTLGVEDVHISTVTLIWESDDDLFDIEWGKAGFAQGNGTTVTGITDKFYKLSGLDADTDYEFYVRTNCGVTQSEWEGPFGFRTSSNDFIYQNGVWSPGDPSGIAIQTDNILVINGSTVLTTDTEVHNLIIMPEAHLKIEGVLTLFGDMIIEGDLTFVSAPTTQGELAAVSATSTITGEVTVEHYMKDRRSYRMVSSAVTTTTSIHDNWQEGAISRSDNPNPGYGTHITGSKIDQEHGFDGTQTGNASMFTLDVQNQMFKVIANTDVNTLTAGDAYLMFIRGDRTLSNIDTPDGHTATTLRARGQLVTGNHTQLFSTTVAGQFVMFGNPYQSAVDINDVFANSTNVNTNQYYVYDVNIGDYGN
ncbi:MAG: fibronectin type III domain-containing protein, partial [Bacteroidetes bacterium]|nr:fibronectin type III domain-containing protein [Bacteroidota bacterium]